jgi:hypothetical protein
MLSRAQCLSRQRRVKLKARPDALSSNVEEIICHDAIAAEARFV